MSPIAHLQTSTKAASIGIVLGGALWGLFWIPLRAFEDIGFEGAYPGFVFYIIALLVFLPLTLAFRTPITSKRDLALAGLLTGTAFSFYGTSIILTDVVRALLFFYLTPIWGTAIGILFLGERLTAARVIAILLAFAGLFAVIGFGSRDAINLGDLLAFTSGILWTIGSYKIYQMKDTPAVQLCTGFLTGAIVATAALIAFGGDALRGTDPFPALAPLWPYLLATALYALPMILLTIWPPKVLTPGRIGILLMSEVVVGFISVALFAGDPLGPFEIIGAILIVAATSLEILGNKDAT
ncbi:EamA domain-containing membrane protein RarD [Cognatiyoonia sediminum]|uniref:EamA domain-containing membrane protein RarD n=1 Tax=Cognatiyoonia sediminum TaxID=1508389 RepID=A0A1M5QUV1_9RHOB|nr:DMT family transporter [Cognatiyoonia sediminum]SHH17323.1 EamA domain-containing membrane protein RarD [Cognatiyoonia sediminum]